MHKTVHCNYHTYIEDCVELCVLMHIQSLYTSNFRAQSAAWMCVSMRMLYAK